MDLATVFFAASAQRRYFWQHLRSGKNASFQIFMSNLQ
jgi:hypothetical protein